MHSLGDGHMEPSVQVPHTRCEGMQSWHTLKAAAEIWGSEPWGPLKSAAMRDAMVAASTEMPLSCRAWLSSLALIQPSPFLSMYATSQKVGVSFDC